MLFSVESSSNSVVLHAYVYPGVCRDRQLRAGSLCGIHSDRFRVVLGLGI